MSDERITIELKVASEIWWITTIAEHTLPAPYWTSGADGQWRALEAQSYDEATSMLMPQGDDPSRWIVTIEGDDDTSNIRIITQPDQEEQWVNWLGKIGRFAAMAQQRRQSFRKITADDIIDKYYFLKHIGQKKTLKQLAEQYDFSENYLYQAKAIYDKTGKFGRNLRQAYKVSTEP